MRPHSSSLITHAWVCGYCERSSSMIPKPKHINAAQWIAQVEDEVGVLAAMPRRLWHESDPRSHLTIGRLSGEIGNAAWWSRERPVEGSGFEKWFPESTVYDKQMLSLEWDRLTLAGVTFQTFSQDAVLLQLEAAARGIAPAVFAHFGNSGYTQLHSFKLHAMLKAFNRLLGDPLRRPSAPTFEGTIYESTASVARKIRELADARILKINMTTESIVFCPLLHEAESGNLEENGYGYDGLANIKGIPYLTHFEGRFCKKIAQANTDYDADCAYLLMTLVLMANVKAAHGHAAAKLMMDKLLGRKINGSHLPPDELPPGFERVGLLQVSKKLGDNPGLVAAFCNSLKACFVTEDGDLHEDLANGLTDILKAQLEPSTRNFFPRLVSCLQDSTEVSTDIFNPVSSETFDSLERVHLVERRLLAVVEARMGKVCV